MSVGNQGGSVPLRKLKNSESVIIVNGDVSLPRSFTYVKENVFFYVVVGMG